MPAILDLLKYLTFIGYHSSYGHSTTPPSEAELDLPPLLHLNAAGNITEGADIPRMAISMRLRQPNAPTPKMDATMTPTRQCSDRDDTRMQELQVMDQYRRVGDSNSFVKTFTLATQQNARNICMMQGGDLLYTPNRGFILQLDMPNNNAYWVGLTYSSSRGAYVWLRNQSKIEPRSSELWGRLNPPIEQCVLLETNQLWPRPCSQQAITLCEIQYGHQDSKIDILFDKALDLALGHPLAVTCRAQIPLGREMYLKAVIGPNNVTVFSNGSVYTEGPPVPEKMKDYFFNLKNQGKFYSMNEGGECVKSVTQYYGAWAIQALQGSSIHCCVHNDMCSPLHASIKVSYKPPLLTVAPDNPPGFRVYASLTAQCHCIAVTGTGDTMTLGVKHTNMRGRMWATLIKFNRTTAQKNGIFKLNIDVTDIKGVSNIPELGGNRISARLTFTVTGEHDGLQCVCIAYNGLEYFRQGMLPRDDERVSASDTLTVLYLPGRPYLKFIYKYSKKRIYHGDLLKASCEATMATNGSLIWYLEDSNGIVVWPSSEVDSKYRGKKIELQGVKVDNDLEENQLNPILGSRMVSIFSTVAYTNMSSMRVACRNELPEPVYRVDGLKYSHVKRTKPIVISYKSTFPPDVSMERTRENGTVILHITCNAHVGTDGALTWTLIRKNRGGNLYWYIDLEGRLTSPRIYTFIEVDLLKVTLDQESGPTIFSEIRIPLNLKTRGATLLCYSIHPQKVPDYINTTLQMKSLGASISLPHRSFEYEFGNSSSLFLQVAAFIMGFMVVLLLLDTCTVLARTKGDLPFSSWDFSNEPELSSEDYVAMRKVLKEKLLSTKESAWNLHSSGTSHEYQLQDGRLSSKSGTYL